MGQRQVLAAVAMSIALWLSDPGVAAAATPPPADGETKDVFWLFALAGHSPFNDSPLGTSAGIHVGLGSFFSRGFYELGLDVLSGPYHSPGGDGLGTDYNGTGISGQLGWHVGPGRFRDRMLSGGLVLGAEYSDVTGTRFSRQSDGGVGRENLRVIRYLVVPGIYFGFWRQPRPDGNAIELLDTRIESAILSLSLSLPVFNHRQGHSRPGEWRLKAGDEASDDSLDQSFLKVGIQVFLGV